MTESRNYGTTEGQGESSIAPLFQSGAIKINLRIISKPHAYLQSMVTISVKFQENRNKTVGGVAHTRYPLSIHFIKN